MTRWLLGALLFGCSSPRPDPVPVGSARAPAPPADAALVPTDPPRLDAPRSTCVLRGVWKDQPKTLALADGDTPFGEVFEITAATATLGTGVFAEFTTATARLAGYIDTSKLHVHAAEPFLVGDVAAPGPKLPMTYVATAGDQITFELPLPAYAKTQAPLRATRACKSLAIDDRTEFSPRDAVDADAQSHGLLRAKRAVPLAALPGKPAAVTLTYGSAQPVDILETSGKQSRVVVEVSSLNPAEQLVFVGWVPSAAIAKGGGGMGGSWATGGDRPAQRTPPSKHAKRVACPGEIPLVVELGGERRTVGVVLPNAVLEIVADADLSEIRFAKPNVELVTGARWLVSRAALAGCAVAP